MAMRQAEEGKFVARIQSCGLARIYFSPEHFSHTESGHIRAGKKHDKAEDFPSEGSSHLVYGCTRANVCDPNLRTTRSV